MTFSPPAGKRFKTCCAAIAGFCLLAAATACSLPSVFRDSLSDIKSILPQESVLVRERPFLLGSEADMSLCVLAIATGLGPPVPDKATEQIVTVKALVKPLPGTEPLDSPKPVNTMPMHARLNAVISPEGVVTAGKGWTASRYAYQLTGLKPAKNITFGRPVVIPIITPKGDPYVLDIILRNTVAKRWQTARFVNFSQSPILKSLVTSSVALVGRPYVWGGINDFGAGTRRARWNGRRVAGFDCSGLVIYVYQQIGIAIPWRTTAEQWNNLAPVEDRDILPGDLVFWANRQGKIYHVGIILGDIGAGPENNEPDGEWDMLHAPSRNQTVRVEYGFLKGPMYGIAGFRTLIGYNGYRGY